MCLGCGGLRWKILFINPDTNQCSPSWGTPGISTIILIALQCVPIALWLILNLYYVCKKFGMVGIKLPAVAELQPLSHWCVLCWLCADPPLCSDDLGDVRWQSRCWEKPEKIAPTRLSRSQIGYCKFVPDSWSRFWCAAINSWVPGFTNSTHCGNHGCVCQQGNINKTVTRSCVSLASTVPTIGIKV